MGLKSFHRVYADFHPDARPRSLFGRRPQGARPGLFWPRRAAEFFQAFAAFLPSLAIDEAEGAEKLPLIDSMRRPCRVQLRGPWPAFQSDVSAIPQVVQLLQDARVV